MNKFISFNKMGVYSLHNAKFWEPNYLETVGYTIQIVYTECNFINLGFGFENPCERDRILDALTTFMSNPYSTINVFLDEGKMSYTFL